MSHLWIFRLNNLFNYTRADSSLFSHTSTAMDNFVMGFFSLSKDES